jgi:hypothetical protein
MLRSRDLVTAKLLIDGAELSETALEKGPVAGRFDAVATAYYHDEELTKAGCQSSGVSPSDDKATQVKNRRSNDLIGRGYFSGERDDEPQREARSHERPISAEGECTTFGPGGSGRVNGQPILRPRGSVCRCDRDGTPKVLPCQHTLEPAPRKGARS